SLAQAAVAVDEQRVVLHAGKLGDVQGRVVGHVVRRAHDERVHIVAQPRPYREAGEGPAVIGPRLMRRNVAQDGRRGGGGGGGLAEGAEGVGGGGEGAGRTDGRRAVDHRQRRRPRAAGGRARMHRGRGGGGGILLLLTGILARLEKLRHHLEAHGQGPPEHF